MTAHGQIVTIAARATAFTAVCDHCSELNAGEGYSSATFAGRLDLDLDHGSFLCRRGHLVRVERAPASAPDRAADAAA
jgi:hypothetical protein